MSRFKVWDKDSGEEPATDNVDDDRVMSARKAAEFWAEKRAREGHGSDRRDIMVKDVFNRVECYDVTVEAIPSAYARRKVGT